MLYLAPFTGQPRTLLPPSSEERSAEACGKSEAVAYFRKGLEKLGQRTSSCLRDPFGEYLSQNKDISLKVFNLNFLVLNLKKEILFLAANTGTFCEIFAFL